MTKEIATYTVGAIGFETAERRALRRAVDMADTQPAFKPYDKSLGDCPHLIMVDADSPGAMQSWSRFHRANAHRTSCSPIFVGHSLADLPSPKPYVLQRPILDTHVIAVLEQAVAEVYGFQRPVAERPEVSALVVDDSLPVRVQMRGVLSSIASRVDFAESGAQALEMLDERRYSIVFLDSTLPGDEDAYEICGQIKKHPLQRKALAVMLTSNCSPADRVMGLLAGFDNYLPKPIQSAMFANMAADLVRPAAAV